ncbi:hypothetical protein PoB_006871500 [Plakobranchus ocellatus]|uniref:Uncharacterized protein n=1 Tax=Plakobranchus ocellatus TaxID=259542 RepID=A0AAV4DE54_9GAST|nr:hypothetical protein PoB_006871500 [Plakobranchus ocellatus]
MIFKTCNVLPVTNHTLQRVSIAVGQCLALRIHVSSLSLKNVKTNLRSRLSDGSLNACMKLCLTLYQPDNKTISKTMQHHSPDLAPSDFHLLDP